MPAHAEIKIEHVPPDSLPARATIVGVLPMNVLPLKQKLGIPAPSSVTVWTILPGVQRTVPPGRMRTSAGWNLRFIGATSSIATVASGRSPAATITVPCICW
ncbi:MAG: hypothetical protein M3461_11030 [Pseudomonadota bacterium]|nr:hypothetical protein [Pseudomonadota bacterium]